MSTRCNIAIKLRKEDCGKCFETPWGGIARVPKNAVYLYVYCHNDGYPEGVGSDLKGMFVGNGATYKDALEYILKGDRTTSDMSYWEWRQEKDCEPRAAFTEDEMCQQVYLYIIHEEDTINEVTGEPNLGVKTIYCGI